MEFSSDIEEETNECVDKMCPGVVYLQEREFRCL